MNFFYREIVILLQLCPKVSYMYIFMLGYRRDVLSYYTNLGINPLLFSIRFLHSTIEVNWQYIFWSGFFPWVSISQPIIWFFNLKHKWLKSFFLRQLTLYVIFQCELCVSLKEKYRKLILCKKWEFI